MSDDRYKTYMYSYEFQGQRWSFEVKAQSIVEADLRLKKMATANLDGEVMAAIRLGWIDYIRQWFGGKAT